MMEFDIRKTDLNKLNSMTKYPSILTYHKLGEKGALTEEVQISFAGQVIGTEKVDGTNSRIICCPDGSVLLGSREDLLWERRDLIGNNSMGIVDTLRDLAYRMPTARDAILVVFVEVYGKGIGSAAKQYTGDGKVGFRLFDVILLADYASLFAKRPEVLAAWREHGGQPFETVDSIAQYASRLEIEPVPSLFQAEGASLPITIKETYEWLLGWGVSRCPLDESAQKHPEGVVVRTADRKTIAKIRREDYERTIRRSK